MRDYSTINVTLDNTDKAIINQFQDGIPICSEPYLEMAETIGIDVHTLISRIQTLLDNGVLTRFGPLFDTEKMGGTFSLCAMKVPIEQFESISNIVNQFDQVAHNYERDHLLNMWFVLAVEDKQQLAQTISEIEQATGLVVYSFPKQTEFNINLRFKAS